MDGFIQFAFGMVLIALSLACFSLSYLLYELGYNEQRCGETWRFGQYFDVRSGDK